MTNVTLLVGITLALTTVDNLYITAIGVALACLAALKLETENV